MTEHDIQTSICVELSKRGCIVNRTNSGTYYTSDGRTVRIGRPGTSDLQGHRGTDGRCFYIEVKKPGQKPRKNQQDFLDAMRNSNALAGVAHSVEEAVWIVFKEEN